MVPASLGEEDFFEELGCQGKEFSKKKYRERRRAAKERDENADLVVVWRSSNLREKSEK